MLSLDDSHADEDSLSRDMHLAALVMGIFAFSMVERALAGGAAEGKRDHRIGHGPELFLVPCVSGMEGRLELPEEIPLRRPARDSVHAARIGFRQEVHHDGSLEEQILPQLGCACGGKGHWGDGDPSVALCPWPKHPLPCAQFDPWARKRLRGFHRNLPGAGFPRGIQVA